MRVNDQEIARMARQLTDEENSQLRVRPWNRKHNQRIPAWVAAVPAAAVVGFLFGFWMKGNTPADHPLTAVVDTVYITEKDTSTHATDVQVASASNVVASAAEKKPSVPDARPRHVGSRPQQEHTVTVGLPMAEDRIRYDLLVRN